MRNIKSILIILILIFVISMSSCDIIKSSDIQEGTYSSNGFYNRVGDDDETSSINGAYSHVTQINCEFKSITYQQYLSSNENVLMKDDILKICYSINMQYKGKGMDKYCDVIITNVSRIYETTNNVIYEGKASIITEGETLESDFKIYGFFDNRFNIDIFDIEQTLFYESHRMDFGEYELIDSYDIRNIKDKPIAKIIIEEITEDQYSFGSYNQFQGIYGRQFFEVEFYVYNEENEEFEVVSLKFTHLKTKDWEPGEYNYFKAQAFIVKDGEIVLEFELKLIPKNDEGYLEIRTFNNDEKYEYFDKTYIFREK